MGAGILLTEAEHRELAKRARSPTGRAEDARRARVILLLAEGLTWDVVCERAECSRGFVAMWAGRFRAERLAGLYSRHCGQKPFRCTPSVEAKILNATRKPPTDGSSHWSTRRLAAKLGVSHMMVARVWSKHRLQPHRLERYMGSNDPDFEQKTAIQALDRNDPVLSPGRAERHGFEYYRHGTLALYAAFNTKTGEILGETAARHTSEQFVAFLRDIVAHQPAGQEIHVIADNLSAHETKRVHEFLSDHPTVRLHFTPSYSSWLNQVELWFAKISRDVITRGVFSSVADLKSKLMRYIREYNKNPRVVKWHYVDPSRHIGA